MLRAEDIANPVMFVASKPDHVSIEIVVISSTIGRNYLADYVRYVAEGHTQVAID